MKEDDLHKWAEESQDKIEFLVAIIEKLNNVIMLLDFHNNDLNLKAKNVVALIKEEMKSTIGS